MRHHQLKALVSTLASVSLIVACTPSKSSKTKVQSATDVAKAAESKAGGSSGKADSAVSTARVDRRSPEVKQCVVDLCGQGIINGIENVMDGNTVDAQAAKAKNDDVYDKQIKPAAAKYLESRLKEVNALSDRLKTDKGVVIPSDMQLTEDQDRYLKLVMLRKNADLAKKVLDAKIIAKFNDARKVEGDALMQKAVVIHQREGGESFLRTMHPNMSLAKAAAAEAATIKELMGKLTTRIYGSDDSSLNLLGVDDLRVLDAAIANESLSAEAVQALSRLGMAARSVDIEMGDSFKFLTETKFVKKDLDTILGAIDLKAFFAKQVERAQPAVVASCEPAYYQRLALYPETAEDLGKIVDDLKLSAKQMVASDDPVSALIGKYTLNTDVVLAKAERDSLLKRLQAGTDGAEASAQAIAQKTSADGLVQFRALAAAIAGVDVKHPVLPYCSGNAVAFDDLNYDAEVEGRLSSYSASNASAAIAVVAHDLAQVLADSKNLATMQSCVADKMGSGADKSDLADAISSQLLLRYQKDNAAQKVGLVNLGCYLEIVNKTGELSKVDADPRSPNLLRALIIQQQLGAAIPDSCQNLVKAKNLTLPGVCK